MINQSLITQKISELVLEAQTGVKKPRVYHTPAAAHDSVTISRKALLVQRMATAIDGQGEPQKAAQIAHEKKQSGSLGYVVSEEVAEKIARQILGLEL